MKWRALAVATVLMLAGCRVRQDGQGTFGSRADVVASYADHAITRHEVLKRMQTLPPPARAYLVDPERKRGFVENMVLTDMMYEEGRALGYASDPAITSQPEDVRKALVVRKVMAADRNPRPVTDEEVRRYYDEHGRRYVKKKGKLPPFASVKEPIRNYLTTQRVEEQIQTHVEALKQRANLRIDDEALARVDPLAGLKSPPALPDPGGH